MSRRRGPHRRAARGASTRSAGVRPPPPRPAAGALRRARRLRRRQRRLHRGGRRARRPGRRRRARGRPGCAPPTSTCIVSTTVTGLAVPVAGRPHRRPDRAAPGRRAGADARPGLRGRGGRHRPPARLPARPPRRGRGAGRRRAVLADHPARRRLDGQPGGQRAVRRRRRRGRRRRASDRAARAGSADRVRPRCSATRSHSTRTPSGHGLGRRRQRLPDRARRARSPTWCATTSADDVAALPRRPRPRPRRRRVVGPPPGRAEGHRGDRARRSASSADALALTWRLAAPRRQPLLGVGAARPARHPRPAPARPGSPGVLLAMGPGFCAELVLLRWRMTSADAGLHRAAARGRARAAAPSSWSSPAQRCVGARARRGGVRAPGTTPSMVALHTGLLVGCLRRGAGCAAGRSCRRWAGRCWPWCSPRQGAALVVHRARSGRAVEHPGDRRARPAAGRPRPVPVAAPPQLRRGGRRGVRAAAGAPRLGHRAWSSPSPTPRCSRVRIRAEDRALRAAPGGARRRPATRRPARRGRRPGRAGHRAARARRAG